MSNTDKMSNLHLNLLSACVHILAFDAVYSASRGTLWPGEEWGLFVESWKRKV